MIGPLACRCTAYRLSVDPNFFKKSRGRFSLLKGPSSVSILFPRYLSRRNQIFVLTFQSSYSCPASPSCASSLSIQSVIFAKRSQDISPKIPSHISHPSVHHVSPAASRPLRARGPSRRHSGPRQPVLPCHCEYHIPDSCNMQMFQTSGNVKPWFITWFSRFSHTH